MCDAGDCATSIEDIALALAQHSREPLNSDEARRRCLAIRDDLVHAGVYGSAETGDTTDLTGSSIPAPRFRVAPTPVWLSPSEVAFFQHLGQDLLAFYRALNRLYQESARGVQPAWVSAYLDQGKPESLVTYSRMNRFRNLIPGIIRPDVIPTADGMVITELDSVPGGIGLTGCLTRAYDNQIAGDTPLPDTQPERSPLIAGRDGMLQGFAAMVRAQQGNQQGCLAIVVSDEAKEYRPEMEWMAQRLREIGCQAFCVEPRAIHFSEEGLFLQEPDGPRRIGLLYRFFELFDLKNIPKSELVMYAAKKGQVAVTPPYKPAIEEKLAFALFHHPELTPFWEQTLAPEARENLRRLLPRTWILDPQPGFPQPSSRSDGRRTVPCRIIAAWHNPVKKSANWCSSRSDSQSWLGQPKCVQSDMICRRSSGRGAGARAPISSDHPVFCRNFQKPPLRVRLSRRSANRYGGADVRT